MENVPSWIISEFIPVDLEKRSYKNSTVLKKITLPNNLNWNRAQTKSLKKKIVIFDDYSAKAAKKINEKEREHSRTKWMTALSHRDGKHSRMT